MNNNNKNKRTDGKAYKFAYCPLSRMTVNACRFSWHYAGNIHCFYGGDDLIVTKQNVNCPYISMVKVVNRKKKEMEASVRDIVQFVLSDDNPSSVNPNDENNN